MSDKNLPPAGLPAKVEPIAKCYVQANCDFITEVLKELSELVSSGLFNLIPNSANEVLKELSKSTLSRLSNLIPNSANEAVSYVIEESLRYVYDAAEFTQSSDKSAEQAFNRVAVTIVSSFGGAGGLPTKIAELPVMIGLIFREIQLVSKQYGRDPACEMAKRECLSVFLLGTSLEGDSTIDSEFIVLKIGPQVPTVQCLITKIVPQLVKVFAPMLISPPVIGAAIDAVLNLIYIEHYRKLAHVKFQLAELSRSYDPVDVQAEFKQQVEAHRIGCQ